MGRGESNSRRNSLKLKQYRSRNRDHTNGSTNTNFIPSFISIPARTTDMRRASLVKQQAERP